MRYIMADIHGEYELFLKMLEKISFSDSDELYICGDIIDKGPQSVRLAGYISSLKNVHAILGNHEHMFLQFYHSLLSDSGESSDAIMSKLREYFPDGELLDWEIVDFIDGLPAYIEEEDFICVHAGVPLDSQRRILPLSSASVNQLVNDRRFKEPSVKHESEKCVFFGHTQTNCISGECKILGYPREKGKKPSTVSDFYKIHLDTGAWSNGVLGCFAIDSLRAFYVYKS